MSENFYRIHSDLILLINQLYNTYSFVCSPPINEEESLEYGACDFNLNKKSIKYRSAHITPKKIGQFVTLWKRDLKGITKPFDDTDAIDFVMINVRKDDLWGQFIFPKEVLIAHAIFSTKKKEGKRGFRVYPPWDVAENNQAKKTQKWQLEYFFETSDLKSVDIKKFKQMIT